MPTGSTPGDSPVGPRERCEEEGCAGARVEGVHCLEHVTAAEFDAAVMRLRGGEPVDARAITITTQRLQALLDALKDAAGRAVLPVVRFAGATFSSDVSFSGATFSDADFSGATFNGKADFGGATFSGPARFCDVTFSDEAGFATTTFSGQANFARAIFSGQAREARFSRAIFNGNAEFVGAIFSGYANFARATFSGDADFVQATFSSYANFDGASFTGDAEFYEATVSADAQFTRASFARARQIGPLIVGLSLVLDGCVFAERVSIEVAATVVSARSTKFAAGAHIHVRWAEVALHEADFARSSTLSAARAWDARSDLTSRTTEHEPRPRLVTLRGAHVAELSLSDVDLRACRFFGAHGLESLSIEATCTWPHTPPTHRYSDRETIAEEHDWRGSSWEHPTTQPQVWAVVRDGPSQLYPPQIAALYRGLRKAREDDKDQAGAGDLYYGEMEMRRRAALPERGKRGRLRAQSDRAILTAYWLLAGYGLKASRAFIALLTIILVASFGLQAWGFTLDASYTRALLYSIESTSSLFRVPNAPGLEITYAGEAGLTNPEGALWKRFPDPASTSGPR